MAIEASFTVDQTDFPLDIVFDVFPDATVELDRVVPSVECAVPYFWIYAEDIDEFTGDLSRDEEIDDTKIVDEMEDQLLVRVDWDLDHESVLTALVNTDITLLSGLGDEEEWTFEIRSGNQRQLSNFQSYCRENDIAIELDQLHALSSIQSDREYDLTEGQRTALLLAYNRGYFESPREATQADLAEELEISRQAVSSRLQRGIRRLVASTLVTPESDP